MKLPTLADLNHVAQLMHAMDFAPLPLSDKFSIVQIAQQAVLAGVIDDLPVQLGIQFAETLAEHGPKFNKLVETLSEIDGSLGPIMTWFDKSRLYEP